MDDVHRKPKDDERDEVAARIKRAAAEGRISDPDRDIRLGNVRSAQSMWELDLITRELDQNEGVVAPAPQDVAARHAARAGVHPGRRTGEPTCGGGSPVGRPARKRSAGPALLTLLVVLVVAVVGVGAVVVVGFRAVQGFTEDAVQEATDRAADPSAPDLPGPDSGPDGVKYALTPAGISGFLQAYRKRFGTNRVVDLTLYGDYAIVNVPKAKSRQAGWIYRDASGFTSFGGVRATFPGARPIATSRLR